MEYSIIKLLRLTQFVTLPFRRGNVMALHVKVLVVAGCRGSFCEKSPAAAP